jgi:hypothetical protein
MLQLNCYVTDSSPNSSMYGTEHIDENNFKVIILMTYEVS